MCSFQKISQLFRKIGAWFSVTSHLRLILFITFITLTCVLPSCILYAQGFTIQYNRGFGGVKIYEVRSSTGAGITLQILPAFGADEVWLWVWRADNPTPILLWPR